MTNIQRQLLLAVARKHLMEGGWYRARTSGELSSLDTLYRRGALKRRVWSGVEGEPSAAHEYRLSEEVEASVRAT